MKKWIKDDQAKIYQEYKNFLTDDDIFAYLMIVGKFTTTVDFMTTANLMTAY